MATCLTPTDYFASKITAKEATNVDTHADMQLIEIIHVQDLSIFMQ